MRNGRISSRLLTFSDPRGKDNFKVIQALPVPFFATLPNAAVKCRFGQKKIPV